MKVILALSFLIITFLVWASNSSDRPAWIDAPQKGCKLIEMCAVGEAPGMMLASSNARKALASIFKTNIKSNFKANTSVDNDDVSQEVSESINEVTDEVLDGVEIKETYQSDTTVYALAVLNKKKAGERIKKKIDEIDAKMKSFAEDKRKSASMKLLKLFNERTPLNDRYAFLTGKGAPSPYSYEDIYKMRQDAVKGIVLFVDIEEDNSDQIETIIAEYFTNQNFKVVRKDSMKNLATHLVTGKFSSAKQYLKVNGFEKYQFVFDLSSANKKGEKSGVFQFTTNVIGRDYAQVYLKAVEQLKVYINENMSELNID